MITKDLGVDNFTKIDNDLKKEVSANALFVYVHFASMHPDKDPNDSYMQTLTNLSSKTYFNAKRELRDKGFIYVEQVGSRKYIYHVGRNAVKRYWLGKK